MNPAPELAEAQHWHRRGDLARAEPLYRSLLAREPGHGGALHFLGLLCAQQKRLDEAIALLGRACALVPDQPHWLTNLGEAQRRSGDSEAACASFEAALRQDPSLIEAWQNLGLVEMARSRDDAAETAFKRALALRPDHAPARSNLAALLLRRRDGEAAIAMLEQALSMGQTSPTNYTNLGLARQQRGEIAAAREAFGLALEREADYPPALLGLADLEHSQQQAESASRLYQLILARPLPAATHCKAWLGLAEIPAAAGQPGSALDVLAAGLRHLPNQPELLLRQAGLFRDVRNFTLAEQAYRSLLALEPDHLSALHSLATLLEEEARHEEARAYYARLRELMPDKDLLALHAELMIPMVLQSSQEADAIEARLHEVLDRWLARGLRYDPAELAFFTGQSLFMIAYHSRGNCLALRQKCARLFAPHLPPLPPLPASPGQRPHIGFLVTRGHEGIFAKSLIPIIDALDPEKYRISLFCEVQGYQRSIAPRVVRGAFTQVDLPQGLAEAASLVHAAGCDLLQFWENGTDSQNFLLPFYRLAPVQMHWGWPISSGNPEMDWYVSGAPCNPDGSESHYSEKLAQLPLMPIGGSRRPPLPERRKTKAELGFAPDQTLYFCAQNLLKLHPDYDWAIQEVLLGDPQGRFLLPCHGRQAVTAALQRRLARSCARVYDRIVWLDRLAYADYIDLISVVDLLLDPWPYVGSTTSVEAIAVGTPVISLPYPHTRGRYTAGLYAQLGLSGYIACDPADYVAKALHYGRDPEARALFSRELLERNEIIFDFAPRLAAYEAFLDRALAEAGRS